MPARHGRVSKAQADDKERPNGDSGSDAWQFVNFSKPQNAQDAAFRKVVRANAMRHYHYRKGQCNKADKAPKKTAFNTTAPYRAKTPRTPISAELKHCGGVVENSRLLDETLSPLKERDQLPREEYRTCNLFAPQTASEISQQPALENGRVALLSLYPDSWSAHAAAATKISRPVLLGCGNSDPFDSFPIGDSSQSSDLIYHCKLP